jgi:aminoglycoside phosphotransferase (APT) family kinase protein
MDEHLISRLFLEATRLKEHEILRIEKLTGNYGHASWKFTTTKEMLLFKVNIRNINNQDLKNEILAHQLLTETNLSVPQILYSSPKPNTLERPYYIQSWLPGVDATVALPKFNKENREKFARSFGTFVAKMHRIESDSFSHALHKKPGKKSLNWKNFVLRKLEGFTFDIRKGNLLPPSFLAAVEEKTRGLIDSIGPDVKPGFTHMDLYLANALVNAENFSAILDFESARFYDPIWDFVKLDAWVFQRFPDLRQPFLQGYSEIIPWKPDFANRLFSYQGVEYLAAFPYFGTRFPDKKMFDNFYQLLETWLGLTKLDEYEEESCIAHRG